jgi:site-specific DNA-adenine methylase
MKPFLKWAGGKRWLVRRYPQLFDVDFDRYVDPPYTVKHNGNGFVKYNESIFSWNDQVRLAQAVKSKARSGASIMVTNAYHPTVVDLYRDFATIVPVERASVLSGDKSYRGKTQEALILVGSNWKDCDPESMIEPATRTCHL